MEKSRQKTWDLLAEVKENPSQVMTTRKGLEIKNNDYNLLVTNEFDIFFCQTSPIGDR